MKARSISIISHLSVLLLGGTIAWWMNKHPSAAHHNLDKTTESSITSPQSNKLLDDVLSHSQKSLGKLNDPEAILADIETLRASTAQSADPQKALVNLMAQIEEIAKKKPLPEADVLWLLEKSKLACVYFDQWMKADSAAALSYLGKNKDNNAFKSVFSHAIHSFEAQIKKLGLQGFAQLCKDHDALGFTLDTIQKNIGARCDVDDFLWLQKIYPRSIAHVKPLIESWDWKRRDELIDRLHDVQKAELIARFCMKPDATGSFEWIMENLSSGEWPEKVRSGLAKSILATHYSNIASMNLDQRVALMRELGTLQQYGEKRVKDEMIFQSTLSLMLQKEGNDVLYQLRTGQISGPEAYEYIKQTTIDVGTYQSELLSQTYRTLAQENQQEALKIIAHLSPKDQEWQKIYASRWWFRTSRPDDFFQLVSSVQTNGDPAMERMLNESWAEKSRVHLSTYGENFFHWLSALPAGENKNRALQAFISQAGTDYPSQVAEAKKLLP